MNVLLYIARYFIIVLQHDLGVGQLEAWMFPLPVVSFLSVAESINLKLGAAVSSAWWSFLCEINVLM